MRTERTEELKTAVAATPVTRLLPAGLPWFLRSLNRYPVPTIVAVAGALIVLRLALRSMSMRR